jgi:hypothetical protein
MRSFLFAALLLGASALQAQELDIFDANDFIDPRDLGATITARGGIQCPCSRVLISRFFTGAATNYVDLLRPTSADVMFAHLATSYYNGHWQLNFKTSYLEDLSNEPSTGAFTETPHRKNTLQLGRYYTFGHVGGEPAMLRAQVTWSRVEYSRLTARTGTGASHYAPVYNSEIGVEVDVRFRALSGSFVYLDDTPPGHGHGAAPPEHRKRLSFIHRLPRYSLGNVDIDASVAAGAYYYRPSATTGQAPPSNQARSSLTRVTVFPSLEVTSPTIPRLDLRFHFRYEPSVQQIAVPGPRGGNSWETTHQFGIFVDRPIFVKTF